MWLFLICLLPVLYFYRVKLVQLLLPFIVPYVMEYLTQNPKTLSVGEKELGEAEISGKLIKIPFRFNGQEYIYWTDYDRRAKSGTKFYSSKGGKKEDLHWCPWIPLTITTTKLKCDYINVVTQESDI